MKPWRRVDAAVEDQATVVYGTAGGLDHLRVTVRRLLN
jgi:hypothetical protein